MLRTTRVKYAFLTLALAFSGSMMLPAQSFADSAGKTVRVGIMSGEEEDVWHVVVQNAKQRHLNVELVSFSDYATVNPALDEHDLDANAFQTPQYLAAQNQQRGYHIQSVGVTYVQPLGLYSHKHKSLKDLQDGATIGIPNDPSNEGRALLLLAQTGLIKLPENPGLYPTILDIADNPHNFEFKELDGGMIARSINDLDAAVVNTTWALKGGLDTDRDRLARESAVHNPYVNLITVNEGDVAQPWAKDLVESFQQPNVAQAIQTVFHGTALPAWQQ